MSIVYVYALIEPATSRAQPEGGQARSIQVHGRRVQLIPVGTMRAAIERFDAAPALSEESLRTQHDTVVALARRFDAVLPARFGAALDIAELERLVTARQRLLRRAFDTVRGREQMTVRIFGPEPPAEGEAPGVPESGTAYLRSRRTAARRGADLGLLDEVARARRAVRPLVERERLDEGRGRVRATLHHLIRRGRAAEYKSLLNQSLDALPAHVEVVVSGPWPPFAFTPDLWP
jgi:Gas vesicle synthesis protein GvpL/GvpF